MLLDLLVLLFEELSLEQVLALEHRVEGRVYFSMSLNLEREEPFYLLRDQE